MDFKHNGITLAPPCAACPEQYDALDQSRNQIGYLRLRHGEFRVNFPNVHSSIIYEASPKEDGGFDDDDDDEREGFLIAAIGAIHVAAFQSEAGLVTSDAHFDGLPHEQFSKK
jgi:hypothetical protein